FFDQVTVSEAVPAHAFQQWMVLAEKPERPLHKLFVSPETHRGTATRNTASGATGGRRGPLCCPCARMRENTNRLKKCIAPRVIRTKPSLSLSISMAAREVVIVASLFRTSVTKPILIR